MQRKEISQDVWSLKQCYTKEILFFYQLSNHFRFLSPRPSRFSNQIVLKYILIEGPHNGCCTRPPKVCLARTCCAT